MFIVSKKILEVSIINNVDGIVLVDIAINGSDSNEFAGRHIFQKQYSEFLYRMRYMAILSILLHLIVMHNIKYNSQTSYFTHLKINFVSIFIGDSLKKFHFNKRYFSLKTFLSCFQCGLNEKLSEMGSFILFFL